MRLRGTVELGLALLSGIVMAGCTPDCTPAPGPVRPNVVLVTIDTLRADHLGCYGNATVRTPELDRLAAEGALFERCYAPANVTVPSHLTILTSLPLQEHGVFENGGKLERGVEGLPGVFARAGYRTAAVVSAKHLGPEFALAGVVTGVELYDVPRRLSVPSRGDETNRRLFRWIRGVCRNPFFVWVHYWDPHMPYIPPTPFDRAYYHGNATDQRHTSMNGVELAWHFYEMPRLKEVLAPRAAEVEALQRELGVSWRELRDLILYRRDLADFADGPAAEAELRERLVSLASFVRERVQFRSKLADWLTGVRDLGFPRAQYAGEVSYVDRQIGQLRRELERLGVAERTILLVTADHGESLGEHGIYFDHAGLYEPSIRVPLIVWAPQLVQPGRHSEAARGLDVAPTIIRLANLPAPAAMRGRDLFGESGSSEPVLAESYGGLQTMIVDGDWKLIRTRKRFRYTETFVRKAGAAELYDLRSDPGEEENVAEVRPDVLAELAGRMDSWLAERRQSRDGAGVRPETSTATSRSQEQLEGLRALGYIE